MKIKDKLVLFLTLINIINMPESSEINNSLEEIIEMIECPSIKGHDKDQKKCEEYYSLFFKIIRQEMPNNPQINTFKLFFETDNNIKNNFYLHSEKKLKNDIKFAIALIPFLPNLKVPMPLTYIGFKTSFEQYIRKIKSKRHHLVIALNELTE